MEYDLVFEGGGAKGMVFIGAMQAFIEKGNTYNRLLGTSAGAISATFLAAGYTSQEMLDALNEEEAGQPIFASFLGPPPAFSAADIEMSATLAMLRNSDSRLIPEFLEDNIDKKLVSALAKAAPNLFFLIERGGWYSADKFITWMQRKLDEGTFQGKPRNFSKMTMADFYQTTQRELSLVISDTTGERLLVLNHRTTPDVPVVWAVRMSMSIPMIWPEVVWQSEWGTYLDKSLTGHTMVDGGLLSNFPIELFVSDASHHTAVMGPKTEARVLGLLIDESLSVPGAPPKTVGKKSKIDVSKSQLVQRILRLMNTATGARDKMVIDAFETRVARLPAQGYDTTEFHMSSDRRNALIKAGRKTMQEYLVFRDSQSFGLVDDDLDQQTLSRANRVAEQLLNW